MNDLKTLRYRFWTKWPYAGEKKPPMNPEEPLAGCWPMYYLKQDQAGILSDLTGKTVNLDITNPNTVDWHKQLKIVRQILKTLTKPQAEIARYWGTGVATKQWTPIIDRLIDTYGITAPKAARILAAVQSALNDTFVITWFLKFRYLAARPNQYDQNLATVICTPRHPTYPSGHAAVAGCAAAILSYFFPSETGRLKDLAEECALSRLYAGVHFIVDNNEGLWLGRQIGTLVIDTLKKENYKGFDPIDIPLNASRNAQLIPPPYNQVILYDFDTGCRSLVR